jgi:hypothetical protein
MIELIVKFAGVLAICFIAVCLIYFALVFTLYYTFVKAQSLKFLAKTVWNFYSTLPEHKRKYPGYPYVICLFERKTGKILHAQEVTQNFETKEEIEAFFAEFRAKLAKQKEDRK